MHVTDTNVPPKPASCPAEEIEALLASLPDRPMWLRALYAAAGVVALVLGLIGVILPGLPTTPFILLAAACFARSSTRLYRWLLENRLTGPLLRDWVRHRSITRRVRRIALGSMTLMIALSIWILREHPWLQLVLVVAGIIGWWSVLRVPLRDAPATH